MAIETDNSVSLNCEIVLTSTALLISAGVAAASAVGSAVMSKQRASKVQKQAKKQANEAARLAEAMASKAQAPLTITEANVELSSEESLEDAEIKSRSKRSRLRVEQKAGGSKGVGTGLSIG
jgi:archaellin